MLLGSEKAPFQSHSHEPHSCCPPGAGGAACPNPKAVSLLQLRLHLTSTSEETRLHSLILGMSKLTSAYSTNEPWAGDWICIEHPQFLIKKPAFADLKPFMRLFFLRVWIFFSSSPCFWCAGSLPGVVTLILQTGSLLPLCPSSAHITKETFPSP